MPVKRGTGRRRSSHPSTRAFSTATRGQEAKMESSTVIVSHHGPTGMEMPGGYPWLMAGSGLLGGPPPPQALVLVPLVQTSTVFPQAPTRA
uniref:Uncharacterized protein n=1 Tax=Amphimedon queenslandica TaxID=400682 RepID=A0A1X7VA69_AMPQE